MVRLINGDASRCQSVPYFNRNRHALRRCLTHQEAPPGAGSTSTSASSDAATTTTATTAANGESGGGAAATIKLTASYNAAQTKGACRRDATAKEKARRGKAFFMLVLFNALRLRKTAGDLEEKFDVHDEHESDDEEEGLQRKEDDDGANDGDDDDGDDDVVDDDEQRDSGPFNHRPAASSSSSLSSSSSSNRQAAASSTTRIINLTSAGDGCSELPVDDVLDGWFTNSVHLRGFVCYYACVYLGAATPERRHPLWLCFEAEARCDDAIAHRVYRTAELLSSELGFEDGWQAQCTVYFIDDNNEWQELPIVVEAHDNNKCIEYEYSAAIAATE